MVLLSEVRNASGLVFQDRKFVLTPQNVLGRGGGTRGWGHRGEKGWQEFHVVLVASFPFTVSAATCAAPLHLPGAAIPSSARPLASVRRVAAVNARRAVRVGSGEVSTGQA